MSFGFPAYHRATEHFQIPVSALPGIVTQVFTELGWTLTGNTFPYLEASVSVNLASWGEKFKVAVNQDGTLTLSSECRLPTQCVDWGRNRQNVTAFVSKLRLYEQFESQKLRSAGTGDGTSPIDRLISENDR